jgi:hypothetical protein
MQDTPSASDLLESVGDFLEQDIMPGYSGRTAFQLRIAVSVCRILSRQVERDPAFLDEELRLLTQLLGKQPEPAAAAELEAKVRSLTGEFSALIRSGEIFHARSEPEVLDAVETLVRHKLMVVNPDYLEPTGKKASA